MYFYIVELRPQRTILAEMPVRKIGIFPGNAFLIKEYPVKPTRQ